MKKIYRIAVLGMAMATMIVQPANACWSNASQDAAKIKHLNTMLMVTALRCRNTADNFLPQYNQFVVKFSALIGIQNTLLRAQLAQANGAGGALNALDRMSIGYANSYGTGHRSMTCSDLKLLATELVEQPHVTTTLAAVADRVVIGQSWSGQECPVVIASRR
jgi:Golgi nucleoside diphosphatase